MKSLKLYTNIHSDSMNIWFFYKAPGELVTPLVVLRLISLKWTSQHVVKLLFFCISKDDAIFREKWRVSSWSSLQTLAVKSPLTITCSEWTQERDVPWYYPPSLLMIILWLYLLFKTGLQSFLKALSLLKTSPMSAAVTLSDLWGPVTETSV